jgi:multiple sugar transport system permease protein
VATATTTSAPARPTRRRRPGGGRRTLAPYAFLAPAGLLFVAFLAVPIGYTVWLSLRRVQVSGLGLGKGSRTEVWAGLSNYARALGDPEFAGSVGRVALYGLVLVPTMLGLALLFALLLDSRGARGRSFSRTAIFLPYAVPAVVASLLWGFLYLPGVSPFADLLRAAGLGVPNVLSSQLILFAVANIALWGGVGFNMVVLYTSLRAIPSDLYEAARLDGASETAIAWRIKVPIVLPSLVMTFIFSLSRSRCVR